VDVCAATQLLMRVQPAQLLMRVQPSQLLMRVQPTKRFMPKRETHRRTSQLGSKGPIGSKTTSGMMRPPARPAYV
jgi:hypothetical protein